MSENTMSGFRETHDDLAVSIIRWLPCKKAIPKPLFDYEKEIFDALQQTKIRLDKESYRPWHNWVYAEIHFMALLER